jgi:hypothetical protein
MSVSDEEFQRFQNQLLDIKTRNYQLEEQNKKINAGRIQNPISNYQIHRYFYFRKYSIKSSN